MPDTARQLGQWDVKDELLQNWVLWQKHPKHNLYREWKRRNGIKDMPNEYAFYLNLPYRSPESTERFPTVPLTKELCELTSVQYPAQKKKPVHIQKSPSFQILYRTKAEVARYKHLPKPERYDYGFHYLYEDLFRWRGERWGLGYGVWWSHFEQGAELPIKDIEEDAGEEYAERVDEWSEDRAEDADFDTVPEIDDESNIEPDIDSSTLLDDPDSAILKEVEDIDEKLSRQRVPYPAESINVKYLLETLDETTIKELQKEGYLLFYPAWQEELQHPAWERVRQKDDEGGSDLDEYQCYGSYHYETDEKNTQFGDGDEGHPDLSIYRVRPLYVKYITMDIPTGEPWDYKGDMKTIVPEENIKAEFKYQNCKYIGSWFFHTKDPLLPFPDYCEECIFSFKASLNRCKTLDINHCTHTGDIRQVFYTKDDLVTCNHKKFKNAFEPWTRRNHTIQKRYREWSRPRPHPLPSFRYAERKSYLWDGIIQRLYKERKSYEWALGDMGKPQKHFFSMRWIYDYDGARYLRMSGWLDDQIREALRLEYWWFEMWNTVCETKRIQSNVRWILRRRYGRRKKLTPDEILIVDQLKRELIWCEHMINDKREFTIMSRFGSRHTTDEHLRIIQEKLKDIRQYLKK
jgi:hypothetical protein